MSTLHRPSIQPSPPCPPSGSPKTRKHRCRFHNIVFVKEIPSHRTYSLFEKQSTWYNHLDYRCFKLAIFVERFPDAFGDGNQPEQQYHPPKANHKNTMRQLHDISSKPPPRTSSPNSNQACLSTNLPLYSPPLRIRKEPKNDEFKFSTVDGDALSKAKAYTDQQQIFHRYPPKRVISMGEKISMIQARRKLREQREQETRRLPEREQHFSTRLCEAQPKRKIKIQQEQRQEKQHPAPPRDRQAIRNTLPCGFDVGDENSIRKNTDHVLGFGTKRNTPNNLPLQLRSKQLYELPNKPCQELPTMVILDSALAIF